MTETKLPFIFARIEENPRAIEYPIKDWVVMVANPDFVTYNTEWMDHDGLGNLCLIPSVDICVEDDAVFQTYHEAREYIRQWWCKQQQTIFIKDAS